jgi:hypothetical protein
MPLETYEPGDYLLEINIFSEEQNHYFSIKDDHWRAREYSRDFVLPLNMEALDRHYVLLGQLLARLLVLVV